MVVAEHAMILHTINKSPTSHSTFDDCWAVLKEGSSVVLIEDGVYAGTSGMASAKKISACDNCQIYALSADVEARGLADRMLEKVQLIDYKGFVDLVTQSSAVQSWN